MYIMYIYIYIYIWFFCFRTGVVAQKFCFDILSYVWLSRHSHIYYKLFVEPKKSMILCLLTISIDRKPKTTIFSTFELYL